MKTSTAGEVPSETSVETNQLGRICGELYARFHALHAKAVGRQLESSSITEEVDAFPELNAFSDSLFPRLQHLTFLHVPVSMPLGKSYLSLEASQPWIVYWTLHSLDLLDELDSFLAADGNRRRTIDFLASCQSPKGGFGGGPGQLPHLSATLAAVLALHIVDAADEVIDREKLLAFLKHMRVPKGGFTMQDEGETDLRGTYCAIASAALTGQLCEDLTDGLGVHLGECQRYDGGLAGDIGAESHAGYTYCGLAALSLIGEAHTRLDIPKLLDWIIHRHSPLEGGFNGRPNKLVDSCYSFWIAACLPIIKFTIWQAALSNSKWGDLPIPPTGSCWISPVPLQAYVLICCQPAFQAWDPEAAKIVSDQGGGFCDKPGKTPDWYHTCYALSGLAIVQEWCKAESETLLPLGNKDSPVSSSTLTLMRSVPKLKNVHPHLNLTYRAIQNVDSEALRALKAFCEFENQPTFLQ